MKVSCKQSYSRLLCKLQGKGLTIGKRKKRWVKTYKLKRTIITLHPANCRSCSILLFPQLYLVQLVSGMDTKILFSQSLTYQEIKAMRSPVVPNYSSTFAPRVLRLSTSLVATQDTLSNVVNPATSTTCLVLI